MSPTRIELLNRSEKRLEGVDSPRLSAELLIADVLGCSRMDLVLERDMEVPAEALVRIESMIERRAGGEPVAYILGNREFYGLDFSVTPDVLIPRPETEHIVEQVESLFSRDAAFRFADLGTGSGILAVTIASLFPQSSCMAMDRSPAALEVARTNASRHGVADRVEFVEGDFTRPLPGGPYELIVSNPPYVTEREYAEASREVTGFEPRAALVSGPDGLDHFRAMLRHVSDSLSAGGWFLAEIGCDQGEAVKFITSCDFPEFGEVSLIQDLAGHDRVACLQKHQLQKYHNSPESLL